MSFCYIVFVGPIFFVSVLGIADGTNLACFILYWFQYTTNFVIYAGRSEQYRRAYIQYLKTTLPWLFKIGSGASRPGGRRHRPNIYIINSVQSAPQLTSPSKGTKGGIKVDLKKSNQSANQV